MRAAPIIAVAIATGLLLTGCTGVAEPEPTVTPSGTPEPAPSASVVAAPVIPPGTVVATGTLQSRLGSTTGDVTITASADGAYRIEITGYSSEVEPAPQIALAPEPIGGEADCSGNLTGSFSFGQLTPVGGRIVQDWQYGRFGSPTQPDRLDPAHFDELVIESFDERLPSEGCFNWVLAHAPLTWTLPVFHEVAPVTDGGAREGANGTTTSDGTGLLGYEVAEGDDSRAVAERFGLAMEDFVYFNPNLGGSTEHPNLRPGSTQALRAPARG